MNLWGKSILVLFGGALLGLTHQALGEEPMREIHVPQGEQISVDGVEKEDFAEFSRIQLEEGASLELPPFKSVYIRELVAKDGARIRIQKSSSGADGSGGELALDGGRGADGASGERTRVFIEDLKGHLVIESRGGDGGRGHPGRHGRQGLDGKDGRDARTLFLGLIYLGNGEDGRPGENGEDGGDGGDGGRGGDGGIVEVFFVKRTSSSQVVVDVDGGDGGEGGNAGLGGLGGNGGKGGAGIKAGRQGPMGKSGRAGNPGRPGIPGLPGKSYVYQVDIPLYYCLANLNALLVTEELSSADYDLCRGVSNLRVHRGKLWPSSHTDVLVTEEGGELTLAANGKNGKSAPASMGPGMRASDGSSGSSGGRLTVLLNEMPKKMNIWAQGGRGGDGGAGGHGKRGPDGQNGRDGNLFRHATSGTAGGDGGDGVHGSNGGDGGAGGSIRIIYLGDEDSMEALKDRIDVHLEGGLAGSAGLGGFGGRGGQGGKAGKKFWPKDQVFDGADGRRGQDGSRGRDGRRGEDGEIEFLQVQSLNDWIVSEFEEHSKKYFSPLRP